MRIAFVKQKYVPFGGGEGYLERLMAGCRDAGHDVHLVTGSWGDGRIEGVEVHAVRYRAHSRAARVRSFSRAARACIEQRDFDLVVSLDRTERQDVWRAGEGVHRAWLERRREYEPRWRTWLSERSAGQRALLALEAAAVANARVIIANSHMVARDVRRIYPKSPARIEVVHNGVDLARFSPRDRAPARAELGPRWGVSDTTPLLLFAGSGFRRKGLAELMRAMWELDDCRLIVLGRDPAAPWRRRARRLGVANRVFFFEPVAEIEAAYRASDVLVLPSWFDAFPNVCLEALACGTPVVTTQYTGAAEIIRDGETGSAVATPAAIPDLVAAIRHHISRRDESGRADAITRSVEHLSLERQVGRVLELIEELVRAPSNNPA